MEVRLRQVDESSVRRREKGDAMYAPDNTIDIFNTNKY